MKKVMLLADRDLCDTFQSTLESSYTILPCYDWATAVEMLRQDPEVLILNLLLPERDGLQFLREYRRSLPRRIIVLTPYLDCHISDDLFRLNVDAVLRLPIGAGCLGRKLEELGIKKHPSR